jgi:hypothetical protein
LKKIHHRVGHGSQGILVMTEHPVGGHFVQCAKEELGNSLSSAGCESGLAADPPRRPHE